MKQFILTIVMFLLANRADAACTAPTGATRAFIYNSDHHTYQFCNGTKWIAVGGSVAQSDFAGAGSLNIGSTNIEATADDTNANYLVASRSVLAHAGTIQSISMYYSVAAGNVRFGIYDSSGPNGGPGKKKAETAAITPTTGWNTVAVIAPVLLPKGAYWIAFLSNNDALSTFKSNSGPDLLYFTGFTYGALPSTFSPTPMSAGYSPYSLYATFNIAGCSNPTGTERQIIYNTDFHTYQYCNGDSWVKMGAGTGGGGGGCANPTGAERKIIYNTDFNTYQFCNGTNWVKYLGGAGGGTANSSTGYFVMSKTKWNGNLGGFSGANAKCLSDLTTNTGWKGYADANSRGILIAAKVKAFICYNITCQTPLAGKTYSFANANDGTKGGARLSVDANGIGPNDLAYWNGTNYFGGNYIYWTDRAYGTDGGVWGTTDWASFARCDGGGGWDSSSAASEGAYGDSSSNDAPRWYSGGTIPCNTTQNLVCIVNP